MKHVKQSGYYLSLLRQLHARLEQSDELESSVGTGGVPLQHLVSNERLVALQHLLHLQALRPRLGRQVRQTQVILLTTTSL